MTEAIFTRTVIIGSGCAAWSAALHLNDLRDTDFLLLAEDINAGTSRNTGSDKQTYYKLSLCGDEGDSVGQMARDLMTGPDVDGDIALCEAAGSARGFYRLANLGVPFPHNAYGEYAGYMTDHDRRARATSAGPLTSRYMTEALEKAAMTKGTRVLDKHMAIELLCGKNGIEGVLCLDLRENQLKTIACSHVILCTGGPAHIYLDSVYPLSQHGMSGLALRAGATAANLHIWQYGLASTAFRWNVSGSYQQALPRYVSVDAKGIEREFLIQAMKPAEALNLTFLKGYQWPFDERKIPGSSQIDLLVKQETDHDRRVYLDYKRNPTGYDESAMSEETHTYLKNCGALQSTPLERLKAINAPAIELYRNNGIHLESEMLEIKVCAQHHNGGIMVDDNWQSDVPGLYVAGEAAGTFGRVRPGGSALNSTQVGSLRAAQHIAQKSARPNPTKAPPSEKLFLPYGDAQGNPDVLALSMQTAMSRVAGVSKNATGIKAHLVHVRRGLENTRKMNADDPNLVSRILLKDLLETQKAVLETMLYTLEHPALGVLETRPKGCSYREPRPLPERNLWFESVWREYRGETDR